MEASDVDRLTISDRKRAILPDILALVSVGAVASLVTLLCVRDARLSPADGLVPLMIIGLGSGGLILFRQLRKGASDLMTREARAQYMATHDELTQLPNKKLFVRRLAEVAAEAPGGWDEPATYVLCIGLDKFDEVVEFLGIAASDQAVVEVAARLDAQANRQGALARLGDDVFGLIWSGASRDEARAFAEGLVAGASQPYGLASGSASLTASVGLSFLGEAQSHPAEALRRAQMALSAARRLGGAKVAFYQPTMDEALRRRKVMETELRQAVADSAFSLVYQPQVTAKGVMVGVEALMRWTNPAQGEISPTVFVPLAESCGLGDALGLLALRQAFADAKKWQGLKIAVNITAPHVRSGTLVQTLRELLADSQLSARDFEIEITESLLLNDDPEIHDTLQAIRRLGFSIALDDFGTGYSSLSYLRRFPVDKIKIDRAFIQQLGRQPESSAIVRAIVELAEALELKVIAEGVETRDQVERLEGLGCALYQGYFYSRPVTANGISDLLAGRARLAA
jgi:diguanylate cyclase (GGDEF)-like protein